MAAWRDPAAGAVPLLGVVMPGAGTVPLPAFTTGPGVSGTTESTTTVATAAGESSSAPAAAVGGPLTFDPLHDHPPLNADPKGTVEERMMTYLTYVGAIYAINQREGRGATPTEVRKYAIRAGYPDGRAVSGFSNGGGATESRDNTRWVNTNGAAWLTELQTQLDVHLPDDLT